MNGEKKDQKFGSDLHSLDKKGDKNNFPPSPFRMNSKTAKPEEKKVDFKVETMPMAGSKTKPKKRASLKILIPLLILLILGLLGAMAWVFRDSLQLDKYFPSLFGNQEQSTETATSQSNQTKTSENMTNGTSNGESKVSEGDLVSRVEALEKKQEDFVLKKDLNDVVGFLKRTDTDGDGISDYEEVVVYLTNPDKTDSDEDGFSDKDEVENGYNPNGEGKMESKNSQQSEENSDKKEESVVNKGDVTGNYTGVFSLTDLELSAKDVKFSLDKENKATGSYTFLYQENTYRTEFSGEAKVDLEKNEINLNGEGKTIVGNEEEKHKVDLFLTYYPAKQSLEGIIELKEGQKEFLKDQKGEIKLKKLTNGSSSLPSLPN